MSSTGLAQLISTVEIRNGGTLNAIPDPANEPHFEPDYWIQCQVNRMTGPDIVTFNESRFKDLVVDYEKLFIGKANDHEKARILLMLEYGDVLSSRCGFMRDTGVFGKSMVEDLGWIEARYERIPRVIRPEVAAFSVVSVISIVSAAIVGMLWGLNATIPLLGAAVTSAFGILPLVLATKRIARAT